LCSPQSSQGARTGSDGVNVRQCAVADSGEIGLAWCIGFHISGLVGRVSADDQEMALALSRQLNAVT
jgi:hypothetical protein